MIKLWPDLSRDSVVKTASYLIFIEVQTLNYRAVDITDQFYIWLSRNQMVELSWSVEFKILGTIKRYKSFLYNLILILAKKVFQLSYSNSSIKYAIIYHCGGGKLT